MPATAAPALDVKRISETYFAAWEARDPDAIAALHTEDTMFWSHFAGEPVIGRAAVRDTFAGLFETFEDFAFETYRVVHGRRPLGPRLGADRPGRRHPGALRLHGPGDALARGPRRAKGHLHRREPDPAALLAARTEAPA